MMADPIRTLVGMLSRGPVASSVLRIAERVVPWPRGVVAILTYHRVDTVDARPDLMPGLVSATPGRFADQMATIAEHYRPVGLEEVIDALARPDRLPPRAVLVTFDDAYADFATHAWPAMRALGIPATMFVPTGQVADSSRPFWWDRLWAACRGSSVTLPVGGVIESLPVGSPGDCDRTVRTLRDRIKSLDHEAAMALVDDLVGGLGEPGPAPPAVLDWPTLRRLAAEGVVLAPHTRSHPLLDRVPIERAIEEITGSLADLQREVGPVPPVLAYPSGAHGGRAVDAAREAGMAAAVTTVRGGNDLHRADPLRLRRINVGQRAHASLIRGQLLWAASVDSGRADRAVHQP